LYASGNSGRVHEIAPNGQLRHSYSVSPADDSAAILSDGKLAIGSGILDLSTGRFLSFWMAQTMTFASPAVGSDGTVYAAAWDTPGLYAFYPNSTAQKWNFIPESQGQPFAGPVVGDNGLVYQAFLDDSCLYAVDAKTGVLAWKANLADPCTVATSDRGLLGVESWSEPVLGPDGTVYASLDDPFIRAVNPATGRIRWVTRLGTDRGFTMAVDKQGYLYAASEDDCLYVLDAQGRQVRQVRVTRLSVSGDRRGGLLLVIESKGWVWTGADDVLYAIAADPACTNTRSRPREGRPRPLRTW
jgi:outer membrane protein assembly factor BamB